MSNDFAKECDGCRYSDIEYDVISVGRDDYITDGMQLCLHPSNENEYWIPYLMNCPLKEMSPWHTK